MKKGHVTIIGSGRSGRGMLGELYDADDFSITFADIRPDLVEGLKKQGYYTVQMTDLNCHNVKERIIRGFDVVDVKKERDRYLEEMIHSDFVSTALLPKDFDAVIEDLVAAVRLRREEGLLTPFFITLGANYVGLYEYFDSHIRAKLESSDLEYYEQYVHLLMSIVNRKNLLPPEEERKGDLYRIIGDNKPVLRVEKDQKLSQCKNLPTFFRMEENLGAAMAIKIWTGNLVQCSMAFVALRDGITDSYHASLHKKASEFAYYASVEGYQAVAEEYGLPPRDNKKMVTIFRNPEFADSLYRIVREPIRKLGRNDRFIGPALCCMKHGILPYYITKCLAYGFCFWREEDPDSVMLHQFIETNGIEKAIIHFCQLDLDKKDEKIIYDLILNAYRELDSKDPLE